MKKNKKDNNDNSSMEEEEEKEEEEGAAMATEEVLKQYLAIDRERHKPDDIKVNIDKKSGEITWKCPCNPYRKGAYSWLGVDRMEKHTSGRQHREYLETQMPPSKPHKNATKGKLEIVVQKYLSIDPRHHKKDDIKVFYDDDHSVKWKCKCMPNRKGYNWNGSQRMRVHTMSLPHINFIQNREGGATSSGSSVPAGAAADSLEDKEPKKRARSPSLEDKDEDWELQKKRRDFQHLVYDKCFEIVKRPNFIESRIEKRADQKIEAMLDDIFK
jgi:hypothetical protein